jgi:hypothetical protein
MIAAIEQGRERERKREKERDAVLNCQYMQRLSKREREGRFS